MSFKIVFFLSRAMKQCTRAWSCADPESFARGDPTLTSFFLFFYEGEEDPNCTKSGPSLALQRHAI